MRTARTAGVVRAGSTMAVATLVSRGTGFVAKVVLVAFLGFGAVNDSYSLANTLPNIIFELLIGGVLTSVAIPLLSRARSDPDGGTAYAQRLMSMAIVALLLATGAAMAAAPLLTRLYFGNSDPALTTHLAYLLLPQIFCYGIAALLGALLNTEERFAAPAWAPVVNNLVVIAVGAMLLTLPSPSAGANGLTTLSTTQFLLLGGGTTAGIVLQAAALVPALRRSGFRFRWRWGLDSRMAEAGRLMAWAVAYTLISQAGYVVTARVAKASQPDGLYGLYTYGSLLFQLPYGILGVSLLTAIMPRMSRHAAAGEMDAVKHDMGVANRLSTVALLPVTAAMIALAAPLAIVTAKYGRVTDSSAHILGLTLAAFAIGLLPLAVTLVQMRVFYAMKDGRTPTLINLVMVAVRIPLLLACLALPPDWVVPGLALAMSVSYVVGVVVGEVWLRARFGPLGSGRTLVTAGKVALASAAGGLAAWAAVEYLLPVTAGSVAQAVLQLIVGGLVGLVVAGAALVLLRVDEVEALRRRLLGQRAAVPDGAAVPPTGLPVAPSSPPVEWRATGPADQSSPAPASRPGGVRTGAGHGTLVGAPPASGPVPRGPTRQGQVSVTEQHHDPSPGPGSPDPEATVAHARAVPARSAAPRDEPAAFAPGTVIGERYRLVSLIGTDAGGNRFWRARDTVLPRDMAVTLLPETPHTAATVARTLRAGRLHHIGLPQTLDVGTIDGGAADRGGERAGDPDDGFDHEPSGGAYIAGQWVDGATLTDLLTGGPLDAEVATALTTRIADAVGEAHRNGIALGAVHPSLVRVNFDGQVRLSHVIAHAGATTDADIRAVGALLYLMLTGTWPLAAADGAPQLAAAPTRGGRELPATEVNPGASVALSALADRMLHPDDPQGIRAIGAITALLRPPETAAPAAPRGGGSQEPQPVRTLAPAERALIRERRIKLSIAGAMLTALAVLIVIVVASLVTQFMTSITEPIKAADQQQVVAPPTSYTTTRTVGGSTTSSESTTSTGGSSVTQTETTTTTTSTEPTTTSAPPAKPVPITDAEVYDPQGTPPKDYTSYVDRAYDGDSSTDWPTWVYKHQFGRAQGGLKDGVGLVLKLSKAITPTSVTVSTGTPGTTVEIRSAASANPPLDSTKVLGKADLGSDPVSITLPSAPKSQYLIVWITKLAPYSGDSAKNQGQFQSSISEVSVAGS
jgi:putative peptidoglycan lipid II flippase